MDEQDRKVAEAILIETALNMARWRCGHTGCRGYLHSQWLGIPGEGDLLDVVCDRCYREYSLSVNFLMVEQPNLPETEKVANPKHHA